MVNNVQGIRREGQKGKKSKWESQESVQMEREEKQEEGGVRAKGEGDRSQTIPLKPLVLGVGPVALLPPSPRKLFLQELLPHLMFLLKPATVYYCAGEGAGNWRRRERGEEQGKEKGVRRVLGEEKGKIRD